MQLNWDKVAQARPTDPTDPSDPAYRWPDQIGTAYVQGATNGIRLALLVSGTPGRANGGRDRVWAPSDPQDFGNFLTAAAKKYSSVRRWMIWGEPNMAVRFKPQQADSGVSARAYAPMLEAAYSALIAQQPAGPHDLRLGARPGEQLVDDPVGHLLADLLGKPLDGQAARPQPRPGQRLIDELIGQLGVTLARQATRVGGDELRSPSGLAALAAANAILVKLNPAVRVLGGHDAPVRSCLHRSSDTPEVPDPGG